MAELESAAPGPGATDSNAEPRRDAAPSASRPAAAGWPHPFHAAVLAASLVGAGEGLAQWYLGGPAVARSPLPPLGPLWLALACGALAALPASMAGLLVGLAALAGRRWCERQSPRLVARWAEDDEAVRRRYAMGVGVVGALMGFVVAAALVLVRLWQLPAADLALKLAVGAVALAALAAAGLGVAVARGSRPLLRWWQQRWGLPWPAAAELRYGVWVLLPTYALLVPLFWSERQLLGRWGHGLGALLVAVTAGAVALGWRRWLRRVGPGSWSGRAVAAAWAVALIVTFGLYERYPSLGRACEHALGAGLGARLLRAVTDLDRDGASSLLGGRDCAPLDGTRGPLMTEVPGNGIDEDCDGTDAERWAVPQPAWSGLLPRAAVRRYHVLWIVPDGVRADHVSALGYSRQTTPNFDALADESLLYRHALSQSSATAFSFASFLTGIYPAALTWYGRGQWPQLADQHVTIAERLQASGYRTAIFLNGWTQRVYPGLLQGFEEVVTLPVRDNWKYWSQQSSPMVTAQAIEFIERALRQGAPFFAVVYYNDPHYPYVRHPDIEPLGRRPIDHYDGELTYTDRHVGHLIDYLRYRSSLWDDTVIVLTSDHGEEFGDHRHRHHARSCHIESVHVPLLVRVPGLEPGSVDRPVALVDLVPTTLELLGVSPEAMDLQGQSLLVPALAPELVPADRPVFCSVASQFQPEERFFRRAVRRGRFALLEDLLTAEVQLFDRSVDPTEQHDLGSDPGQAAAVATLRQLLAHSRTGNLSERL